MKLLFDFRQLAETPHAPMTLNPPCSNETTNEATDEKENEPALLSFVIFVFVFYYAGA